MGKGKGKKGRRDGKASAKKISETPKVPGLPKPVNQVKKVKKQLSREKRSLTSDNPSTSAAAVPIPIGQPKPNLQHAKWPALFKKHLGVIEAHIKSLDRVMQSMKSQMGQMEEKERMEWELGERGNWRVICEMMDRAREVLVGAREAAKGILPPDVLRDKKGLGVVGTSFEPLGPKLKERAAEIGYTKRGKLGLDPDAIIESDTNTDSDVGSDNGSDSDSLGSSSSSEGEDIVASGADFIPLNLGKIIPELDKDVKPQEAKSTNGGSAEPTDKVEPNPYFVIDTNPTPVVLDGSDAGKDDRKSKKRAKGEDGEGKKPKRSKKETATTDKLADPELEVDFAALEVQLQAEIEAGTKEQQAAEARAEAEAAKAEEEKKLKKKRRRSSGDAAPQVPEKKARKEEKAEKSPEGRKRKLDDAAPAEDEVASAPEKKAKKEKSEKKRKADESPYVDANADSGAAEEGASKKKRKHKSRESE